ncbi:transposase family protein [Luteococcus peritonei]|uniref:Transposase family protein n=1 Tax=Luteococcus peritonei TaxID=88874 RepID=A0ABW4RX30_9ACTN
MESAPGEGFCPDCGVLARSHGRHARVLHDVPFGDTAVVIVWRTRTWRCAEPLCGKGSFTEQDPAVAAPRALLTGSSDLRWGSRVEAAGTGAADEGTSRPLSRIQPALGGRLGE